MNRALWKKAIAEAQWLWLALAVLLAAFCLVRVWLVTQFETSRFQAVLEQFWDDYQQFFTVSLAELLTYPCRVALTYSEPVVVVAVAVWAVARGSAAVSGEISRGTMEMLLAQPVSRLQVFFSQAAVTTMGLALLALVTWGAVWVGIEWNTVQVEEPAPAIRIPLLDVEIPIPLTERKMRRVPMSAVVAPRELAPAAFNLFSLGFCMAGVTTLASSWDRYRWRTIGLATGFLVVQFVLKGFGMASPSLAWLRRFTFFTPFEPVRIVAWEADRSGQGWAFVLRDSAAQEAAWGPMAYNAVLLGIGLAAYVAAAVIFQRRDLPAPL